MTTSIISGILHYSYHPSTAPSEGKEGIDGPFRGKSCRRRAMMLPFPHLSLGQGKEGNDAPILQKNAQ